MKRKDIDLKDPVVRKEYYRYCLGRPSDKLIVKTIKKRVRQIVDNGYRGDGAFTTGQISQPLWDERPNEHHYIGQQMSRLVEEYDLPIRNVATKSDSHVLWAIKFDDL